eukprot:TRINITY_DN12859_c0_g1_i1.p1 TRINITY_DN12859_c0_g1~~TRINITY_DN12859_c0_g1_i1.p1  ORF type:complete len:366 (+),score=124.04 TRINITY_DN12859_c0_g1_i1:60-1157(+)
MSTTIICASLNCNKPASKLKCPTCVKKDLPPSFFCSQKCFKANWKFHKILHTAKPKQRLECDECFAGYYFTGDLRPGLVTERRSIPDNILKPEYHENGIPSGESKRAALKNKIYSPEEIEKARTVCRLAREVLDMAGEAVEVGVTTDYIDELVHQACIDRNSYPSPLNYREFPKSCCTSINEVICHGIPDTRKLEDGDIVNIDITLFHDGFHGDLNATYFVGNVDEDSKHLVKTTRECLDLAIEAVKPGTLYRDIGNIISKHATQNNLSVVKSYCGHGIGELFHCAPSVPHYSRNKAIGVMKAGQIFTIEPMINMGGWRDKLWPDDWTAVTADGKRSAQFEETLLVTETGVEVLTGKITDNNSNN